MRRDTKREILDTAKRLFNDRGFNAVSIRDIADELGISNGNLTYYFKRKEEIMEALLEESRDTKPLRAPQTLEELDAFFRDIQQAVRENAFYFWHHAQLSQLSPQIRENQEKRYRINVKMLRQAFASLRADGLIRAERFADEYGSAIDSLLLASIYWIPFCQLKGSDTKQAAYQKHAWAVMNSLLTDQGLARMPKAPGINRS